MHANLRRAPSGVVNIGFASMVRRFPPARAIFLGGSALRWREYAPDPRLSPWVATVWTLECEVSQPLRVLPDGCMDLIGGDLVGTLTAPLLADLRAGDISCGVRLRPGAFTALYCVPASEPAGLRVPLADVIGRPRSLTSLAADALEPDPTSPRHAPSMNGWAGRSPPPTATSSCSRRAA
jgi:hypothetical protein